MHNPSIVSSIVMPIAESSKSRVSHPAWITLIGEGRMNSESPVLTATTYQENIAKLMSSRGGNASRTQRGGRALAFLPEVDEAVV
jgi:hypothetical protein